MLFVPHSSSPNLFRLSLFECTRCQILSKICRPFPEKVHFSESRLSSHDHKQPGYVSPAAGFSSAPYI